MKRDAHYAAALLERRRCERPACRCRQQRSVTHCPAHDDVNPSLAVTVKDGRVLLRCFAGCPQDKVLKACDEVVFGPGTFTALLAGEMASIHHTREKRVRVREVDRDEEPEAIYSYTDENGHLLYEVVRYPGKRFRQRRPDGRGGWIWNLDGVRRVPYRLPQLIEAAHAGHEVWIVEGEKDVHTLEKQGVVATTNPGGAGKWSDAYCEFFHGARITVVADRDRAGREHALKVVDSLRRAGIEYIEIFEPPEGVKDVSELLERGGKLEELVELPLFRRLTFTGQEVEPRPVSWIWEGYVPEAMLTLLAGRPGEGKSTIAVDLTARVTREGGSVLFISAEDDWGRVLRPRLEAAKALLDRVYSIDLQKHGFELPSGIGTLQEALRETQAKLVVLDPINAFIALEVNSHRDHHVRRVLGPLSQLAEKTNVAILALGHLNKSNEEDPLTRVGGSIAYVAAARQVLVAAADPNNEDRRILAPVKSNVARLNPPLAYRVEEAEISAGIKTSRIQWLDTAPEVDVRTLLKAPISEHRTLVPVVTEIIRAVLTSGERPANEVKHEVREALGHVSEGVIAKARQLAGVVVRRRGFGRDGQWVWAVP